MKILIDNGHGQDTAGKRSPDGRLLEWSYNREIARRVVAGLKNLNLDAELLVPEVEDLSLKERCRRVNSICYQLGKTNVCLATGCASTTRTETRIRKPRSTSSVIRPAQAV